MADETNAGARGRWTRPGDPLTERQAAFLAALVEATCELGRPPTIREMGLRLGIGTPNGIICHLKSLRDRDIVRAGEKMSARGRTGLTPRAVRELRDVRAHGGGVRVRMLAPEVVISPADARALARELLEKADAVDAEAGAGG